MQINKKVLTSAITALLLLSMIAVAAPAFAVTLPNTHITKPAAFTNPGAATDYTGAIYVGDKYVVSGTDAADFSVVNVYFDSVSSATLLASTSAGASPNQAHSNWWNVTITIPATTAGAHNIIVSDGTGNVGCPITVTPKITASVTPSTGATVYALPDDIVAIKGTGFAPNSLTTIHFNGGTFTDITVTTDATGSFPASTSITIPHDTTLSATPYTVTATDASSNSATGSITVNYYLAVNPNGATTAVPPGTTVTISGRITANTAYTIALDSQNILTGTSDTNGRFSQSYGLSTFLAAGVHPVTLAATGVTVAPAPLTTGVTPTIVITPPNGAPDAVIGITGTNFDGSANITLSLGSTTVNSTAADSRFGPTLSDGSFATQFTVPSLPAGLYTATVVDQYGASASFSFTIDATPYTTIAPRASTYSQFSIASFNIQSTTTPAFSIFVYDPAGVRAAKIDIIAANYVQVGTTQLVPYTVTSFIISSDATTGTWIWNATIGTKVYAGTFSVLATGTAASSDILNDINQTVTDINNKVTSMSLTLSDLASIKATITKIDGNTATLSTTIGTITTTMNSVTDAVNGLTGSISTIKDGVATLQTSLGTVTTSLSSLDAKIVSLQGDVATLETSLGTVTTSLSNLDSLTTIKDGVANIQTTLGTISGVVTSTQGNVATIQTDLGTVKTNIGTVQSDVSATKDTSASLSPLIIVAIVLALLAAIAAIASIVLMRRKIAG